MPHRALLGKTTSLPIVRFGTPGAFLGLPATDSGTKPPVVLLPRREVPDGAREGDELTVFIYLDSEDRPVATCQAPALTLGQVAFLQVVDLTEFGAFFDWGLPKHLLVPLPEQTRSVQRGERHPIGLYVDDTFRLAGTMKVGELLGRGRAFERGEWVPGEAWRNDPELGLFVIVERRSVGLLPVSEPHVLVRGEGAKFRVAHVLPDGKIELSLRRLAHEEIGADADSILAKLKSPGFPQVSEGSAPEQIHALFGMSKKAFKRGVGSLLKRGLVRLDREGRLLVIDERRSTASAASGSHRRKT